MNRMIALFFFLILFPLCLFAGGEAESGREQALESVAEGQLLPVGAVDPVNYLEDFAFEKSNTTKDPLLFDVDLLRDKIWERGDLVSLRISLVANTESFFKAVPGKYIIYIQNPELFSNSIFTDFLYQKLLSIHELELYFFDPLGIKLIPLEDEGKIRSAVRILRGQKKQYANNILLQHLLQVLKDQFKGERARVLWITDENIIKSTADVNFFNFALPVLSSGNTTFSYLGYGEVPSWTTLNTGLTRHNGNSYFADTEVEICDKLFKDLNTFSKPAVEDIKIRIVWSKMVNELPYYYPEEWYSEIAGFAPPPGTFRPKVFHNLGGMNFSESRRLLHYLRIPSIQTVLEHDIEGYYFFKDNRLTLGTVYLEYYIPMLGKSFFSQKDIIIEYKNATEYSEVINPYVFADTVIQNTPLIIQEISTLVNRNRNYLAALQLVIKHKNLLYRIIPIREDPAVLKDLELLDNYYTLLFNQAKTMNLLN